MLYRSTDRLSRRGAPVKNQAQDIQLSEAITGDGGAIFERLGAHVLPVHFHQSYATRIASAWPCRDLKLSKSEVLSGPIHVTAARHPQKGFVKNSPAT